MKWSPLTTTWVTEIRWNQNVYVVVEYAIFSFLWFNTLRLRQNDCHFADDIFKCIFLNENIGVAIKISPKFVPKGPINNIPTLIQIMACCWPGDKPLSEPMMVSLLMHICIMHICITQLQWVGKIFIIVSHRDSYVNHCHKYKKDISTSVYYYYQIRKMNLFSLLWGRSWSHDIVMFYDVLY